MLLAVYGTLRKGFYNHRLISHCRFLGETKLNGWVMVDVGAYPAIFPGDSQIVVEVYEIDDKDLTTCDYLEGFPSYYNRMLVDTEFGKAWIYFWDSRSDLPLVESGDWND